MKPEPANQDLRQHRPYLRFGHLAIWLVLLISLIASAGGWFIARQHAELEARKRFDEDVNRVATALKERMQVYQDVLHGADGLYAASSSVERNEWHAYLASVSIERRFPGIDAVGFVARVPRNQLNDFLRQTRADKSPDFQVHELGEGPDLLIVKFSEPESRHQSTIGWDMGVDAERRAAAERACDTGRAAMTGEVLLRDDVRGPQAGFLMFLPVYEHAAPTGTVEERRRALTGWVFARFITETLMEGVLGDLKPQLHFRVMDVGGTGMDRIVFDDEPGLSNVRPDDHALFATTIPFGMGGRTWQLAFASKKEFEKATRYGASLLVGVAGLLISLLLTSIAWSLSSTRERALAMAAEMTGTLRETNARLQSEIRERNRSEAALRHSESLYHSLVESLPLSIARKDLEGRVIFANRRFCDELDRPLEELKGRTDADLFPPELAAQHAAADRQVVETGLTQETVEERTQRGQTRYVRAIRVPVYDGGESVIGVLGLFWDVTDRRRAEALLEHERFLLRTLMENLPERIYFKDAQSRFLRSSRAHLRLFGLTRQEDAIGKTDFDFFSEEHARQAFEDEQQLMRRGETVSKEEKETWPDRTVTWALSTKMPLRDEHGQIIGTFGISRDITDRKRAEEAMREARDAAEAASRTKSQFLASMSHELRTPLNSVIGFANILLKNKSGALAATELNFLDRILANGKHLLTLINQILDLSKIEAHRIELQRAPVSLDALIRETLAQQEGLVRDKPVQLIANLPDRVALIEADADKLKQVIINLVGNALKFTEQGSVTVRLVVEADDQRPTRIEVIDTGIGIPANKLGVIFEAFQQADAGTARKYGGTGLGLTISQALCQLMGYHITADSELGRGSTFTIWLGEAAKVAVLPAAPVVPAAINRPPMESELKGKLVLVIDDELDSRTLLTHMIAEVGCQAIAASSGEQGLHMAREFRPDLITVDLMMPQMDGWQLIRALKADPELRDIPVVVVSIVAGENRGGIIGAVDVLQKPVNRDDLRAALRRSLPPARPDILIVDDQEDARRLLAEHLEDEPCTVRMATNGVEALAEIEKSVPDVILLDLMMPEMDGITFLNRIRAVPRFQWVPVVVVTAKELTPAEAEQLRQTAQNVVRKGEVFESDLKSILRRLLQERPKTSPGGSP
jgi:two-component system, sensor histidine kinase and response regulator